MNIETTQSEAIKTLGTEPIPAGPYYREDYFELEREAIFKRTWLQIGHISEIPEPGTFMVREVEIAKASILIVRGKDDQVRAFHNVCPHRGTQLVTPGSEGKRSLFSCPYHAWTFSDDGQLRSAPDFERFYMNKAECGLKPVAAGVCAGLVFINLAPEPAQGLREYLGETLVEKLDALPAARATTFSEYVYEIDANWKLTYDNFQENYHLRFIHPRSGAAGLGPENPFGYPEEFGFHGPHRTQRIWSNPDPQPKPFQAFAFGKAARFAAIDKVGNPEQAKDYYALFPNFFMLGSPMNPFSHLIMPIAPNRTRGVIRVYWVGEDDCASRRFAREYQTATARDIHSEDRSVIEAGQRGLESGALEHIHFQEQEALCRHFFQAVNQRVEAYKAERGQ